MVGRTLSHFTVLKKIGAGAMGEVYLAEDTKLSRRVAMKILPPDLALDGQRRSRFEREAKAVAALNHPNIVHLYSVEQVEDVQFITLEFVRGKTLSALIPDGGMGVAGFFRIATAIADAMSSAHEAGVIHRDLKPDNIMISDEGRLKILDFGLAKLRQGLDGAASGLRTASATSEGLILGTPSYMSPEQAEAKPIDSRSDLFAVGIILYEMATGIRPFQGDSAGSIISSILRDIPPPPSELNPRIPRPLGRVIQRCLIKDRERRIQSAKELRNELEGLKKEVDSGELNASDASTDRLRWSKVLIAGVAALALAATGAGVWNLTRASDPATNTPPVIHRQVSFTGDATFPAISPDGNFAAYMTGQEGISQTLIVHDLSGDRTLEIFEGPSLFSPVWSPDGTQLLVGTSGDAESATVVVPRLGGTPRRLPFYPFLSWSPDGSQFAGCFLSQKKITFVDILSGETRSQPLKGEFTFLGPVDWAPRDDRLLFLSRDGAGQNALWVMAIDGSQEFKILEDRAILYSPRWSENGDAIYYLRTRDQIKELWRVSVPVGATAVDGNPRLVLSGLGAGDYFTLSANRRDLLYTRQSQFSNLWRLNLKESGIDEPSLTRLTSGTLSYAHPKISPDGRRIAFSVGDGQTSDIHVMPSEGGESERLTFFDSKNAHPVWSPDGSEIAFASTEDGAPALWLVPASGGTARRLDSPPVSPSLNLEWAPGPNILFQLPGNRNFGVLHPDSGRTAQLLEDDSLGYAFYPRYAPDGNSVAAYWNQPASRGLWILEPEASSAHYQIGGELGTHSLQQSIDGAAYRGKRIRLSASLKAPAADAPRVHLWLSIQSAAGSKKHHRSDSTAGIDAPPALSETNLWRDYTLSATVEEDTERISFGARIRGEGTFLLDGFTLSVRNTGSDENAWQSIPIANPGFESPREDPAAFAVTGWSLSGRPSRDAEPEQVPLPGFRYAIDDGDAIEGQHSLRIQGTQQGLSDGVFLPLGWSPDGTTILAVESTLGQIVRIPASGGELSMVFDSLFEPGQTIRRGSATPDGKTVILEVIETRSDVWLAQNVDPGVP